MLCNHCSVLGACVNPQRDVNVDHFETISLYCSSANDGCSLCKIIARACLEKTARLLSDTLSVQLSLIKSQGIKISLTGPGTVVLVTYVAFQCLDVPEPLEASLFSKATPNPSTGSEAAFRLVSLWLEECLRKHDRCTYHGPQESPLPRRVLDVGETSQEAEPYLLETAGEKGRYITLSHCWGGHNPIKTKQENLLDHKKEIRYADLPKTFQDAVHVTRKLGCRYLWIDSLCIVQDDSKDWEVEASKMHKYYTQALLTISAADGNDSSAGLFRDRDGLAYQSCVVQAAGHKLYASTNSMSVELKRSSLSPSFRRTRLYTRAWVFQEQVLSLRILSYARDRISWRCQTMVFDERVPFVRPVENFIKEQYSSNMLTMSGDLRTIEGQVARLQRECIFVEQKYGPNTDEDMKHPANRNGCSFSVEDEFMIQWGIIVNEYSQRDLTFQSDKLLAIRGIADAMSSRGAKSYFAGSWVDTPRATVMSLLWARAPGSKPSPRLNSAPSWSWASTSSAVSWPGHLLSRLQPTVTFNGLNISEATKQSCGKLCLRTNVRLGVISNNTLANIHVWAGDSLKLEDFLLSGISTSLSKPNPLVNQGLLAIMLDEHVGTNVPVCLAEVAMGEVDVKGQEDQVHCLVLYKCQGEESSFRRVGYTVWKKQFWAKSNAMPDLKAIQLFIS